MNHTMLRNMCLNKSGLGKLYNKYIERYSTNCDGNEGWGEKAGTLRMSQSLDGPEIALDAGI